MLSKDALEIFLTKYDVKRLELYSDNMADYHLIMDLLPTVARLYFLRQTDFELSAAQMVSIWYRLHSPTRLFKCRCIGV